MEKQALESLAQDLANDVRDSDVKHIVINSEGKSQSISLSEFETLREHLSSLAPDVSVVYQLSLQGLPHLSSDIWP